MSIYYASITSKSNNIIAKDIIVELDKSSISVIDKYCKKHIGSSENQRFIIKQMVINTMYKELFPQLVDSQFVTQEIPQPLNYKLDLSDESSNKYCVINTVRIDFKDSSIDVIDDDLICSNVNAMIIPD